MASFSIKSSLQAALKPYRAAFKNTARFLPAYVGWMLAAATATLSTQLSTSSILELPTALAKAAGAWVCIGAGLFFYSRLCKLQPNVSVVRSGARAVLMALGAGLAAHAMYFVLCAALPFVTNALFSSDYLYAAQVFLIGAIASTLVILPVELLIQGARLNNE